MFRIIFTLIIFISSILIKKIIFLPVIIRRKIKEIKLNHLKQIFKKYPTDKNHFALEIELLRQELSAVNSQLLILKQQVEKGGSRRSCFCMRFSILKHKLEYNLSLQDISLQFKYSTRTISGWITSIKRFGILGLVPQGQLPWSSKLRTSPDIINWTWQLHDENPAWGRWRITQTLLQLGVFTSPSNVRNILRRPRPKTRPWKPRKNIPLVPHLKKIITKARNAIWSIDLSSIMIGPYQCNILGIIDHYSRKILHLGIYFGEPGGQWVVNQICSTIIVHDTPKAIISDHGSQFISSEFKRFTWSFKIEDRKGKVGSPYSNGKIERFFGTLKRELLNQFPASTLSLKRLEKLLRNYKTYYNQCRPHQSLEAAHPEEYYTYNKSIWVKPPKSNKNLPRKIKRIKFCEGTLNHYEAA